MARRSTPKSDAAAQQSITASADDLLLAILEQGGDTTKTGRFLMTFKEGGAAAGVKSLQSKRGLRVANARDFKNQAVSLADAGDAHAMVFPEIGVALVGGAAAAEHGIMTAEFVAADSATQSVDPEYFMFSSQVNPGDYLRGVLRTAEMIYQDLGALPGAEMLGDVSATAVGATWGLRACKVPSSNFDGNGIKVAVLDTGFDLGHPEFAGRPIVSNTFVGQPVQDLHGHGTHTAGTACGPQSPPGPLQRYGIAFRGADVHRKGADQFRLRNAGPGPGRHELGHCKSVRGDLDVAWRADTAPAVLYGGRRSGPRRRMSDRRRSGQCKHTSRQDPARRRTGELADHRFGRCARQFAPGGVVLERRQGRYRRSRREHVFVVAAPAIAQHHQRHQHGHAACRGLCRLVGSEQCKPAGNCIARQADVDGQTPAVARNRRRRRSGAGSVTALRILHRSLCSGAGYARWHPDPLAAPRRVQITA